MLGARAVPLWAVFLVRHLWLLGASSSGWIWSLCAVAASDGLSVPVGYHLFG